MTSPGTTAAGLDAIAAKAAHDAGGIDAELLGDFLPVLAAAVGTGTRLRRTELAGYRDSGRRAAARGVALRALVDLYLSAAWRLWRHLPEVQRAAQDPAAVVLAGEVMLRAADDAVAVLTEGYQLARRDLVRAQAAARREFVDDLLLGGAQALSGLVDRAALFGLSLAGPHAVVVVQADKPFTDSSPLTGLLERSIQGSKADADALVTTKEGALVVIFAAPDRNAIDEVIKGLTRSLPGVSLDRAAKLRRTAPVGDWRIGVGQGHQGPSGVRLSFEQAQEALELGARLGGNERVLNAADLLVQRVLVRDESAMRELLEGVLTPLLDARGGAEPLLRTLEAYFAAGGNASLSARSLHLSVRALTYRLEKIAQLTGRDPADPAQRFELQTAVLGARLLHWPEKS
ncbi:sugar diacid utilization regulator [Nakamurella sp. UYEF19]|uniref:PucR family transcriptional regulator n=1 Tax=Nakamurella sp. UYEF19 TaxID=1756392 RepID=UPI003396F0E7